MSANPDASVAQARQYDDLTLAETYVRSATRRPEQADGVRLIERAPTTLAEAEAWYAASSAVLWGLSALRALADPERH